MESTSDKFGNAAGVWFYCDLSSANALIRIPDLYAYTPSVAGIFAREGIRRVEKFEKLCSMSREGYTLCAYSNSNGWNLKTHERPSRNFKRCR